MFYAFMIVGGVLEQHPFGKLHEVWSYATAVGGIVTEVQKLNVFTNEYTTIWYI